MPDFGDRNLFFGSIFELNTIVFLELPLNICKKKLTLHQIIIKQTDIYYFVQTSLQWSLKLKTGGWNNIHLKACITKKVPKSPKPGNLAGGRARPGVSHQAMELKRNLAAHLTHSWIPNELLTGSENRELIEWKSLWEISSSENNFSKFPIYVKEYYSFWLGIDTIEIWSYRLMLDHASLECLATDFSTRHVENYSELENLIFPSVDTFISAFTGNKICITVHIFFTSV